MTIAKLYDAQTVRARFQRDNLELIDRLLASAYSLERLVPDGHSPIVSRHDVAEHAALWYSTTIAARPTGRTE